MQKVGLFWERIRSALAARLELRTEWESRVRTGNARADAGGQRVTIPARLNSGLQEIRSDSQTRLRAQNAKLEQSSAEADMDSSGGAPGFLLAMDWSRNTGSTRLEHRRARRDSVQVDCWPPGQREFRFSARNNKKQDRLMISDPAPLTLRTRRGPSTWFRGKCFIAALIAAGLNSDRESTCDSRNRCPGY
jgi:hypothetical protein